jgi:hypothetical protein
MKMWRLIFCLLSTGIFAQPVDNRLWTAKPDTQVILIGEQIRLDLTLESLAADSVQWPMFGDTLIKNIEIVDRTQIDTIYEGNDLSRRKLLQTLTLTSFDSGYYAVPPIEVMINGLPYQTRPFLISVATIAIDSTNAIADIKDIIQDPPTFMDYVRKYWPYGAGFLGLFAVLATLYYFWRKRKSRPVEASSVVPVEPAHVIALRRLAYLQSEKLWQQGFVKEYHASVSEIIRQYLELRFYFDALEKTTDEIMAEVRLSDIPALHQARLLKLLRLTDLVKFAKEHPLPSENEEMIEIAIAFVKATQLVQLEENEPKLKTADAGN